MSYPWAVRDDEIERVVDRWTDGFEYRVVVMKTTGSTQLHRRCPNLGGAWVEIATSEPERALTVRLRAIVYALDEIMQKLERLKAKLERDRWRAL